MDNKNNIPNFRQIANELVKNASRIAASESVKFFKESFTKGGFTDSSFQKWQQTNNPAAGKHTMYRQGNLMRSIHKQSATTSKIIVVSETKYSEIHNSGGTITMTEGMKAHFWKAYYEEMGRSKSKNKKIESKKAKFFRYMALKKVGSKIKIPKRQFMGNSQTMMNKFDSEFAKTVRTQVEPQFNNQTVTITVTDI